jgi:hypothetical protein
MKPSPKALKTLRMGRKRIRMGMGETEQGEKSRLWWREKKAA